MSGSLAPLVPTEPRHSACSGSSTAKAPRQPNKLAGEGGWTFRAPRQGDLVVCPYCDADTFICDHCGGERRLYANEVFQ